MTVTSVFDIDLGGALTVGVGIFHKVHINDLLTLKD